MTELRGYCDDDTCCIEFAVSGRERAEYIQLRIVFRIRLQSRGALLPMRNRYSHVSRSSWRGRSDTLADFPR